MPQQTPLPFRDLSARGVWDGEGLENARAGEKCRRTPKLPDGRQAVERIAEVMAVLESGTVSVASTSCTTTETSATSLTAVNPDPSMPTESRGPLVPTPCHGRDTCSTCVTNLADDLVRERSSLSLRSRLSRIERRPHRHLGDHTR